MRLSVAAVNALEYGKQFEVSVIEDRVNYIFKAITGESIRKQLLIRQ